MKCSGQVSEDKPLFVSEFGCSAATVDDHNPEEDTQAATWAEAALNHIFDQKKGRKYPDLIGFNWWNEGWKNGDGEPITEMRIERIKSLGEKFAHALSENAALIQESLNY